MLLMKESCLSLKEKKHDIGFLLSNYPNVLKLCITHLLIFFWDDFVTRLQSYMIEFSCLYITQGH